MKITDDYLPFGIGRCGWNLFRPLPRVEANLSCNWPPLEVSEISLNTIPFLGGLKTITWVVATQTFKNIYPEPWGDDPF